MKKSLSAFLVAFIVTSVFGQGVLSYSGNHNYTLVERTNLRRYDNGKYTGLMSREVRSFITYEYNRNGDRYYSGDFFVSQDTVRAQKVMLTGIHESIPSSFIINENGKLTMRVDNGYPSFRSFPTFPQDSVKIGDTWRGDSIRAIDPLNNGTITKIPMTILYKFIGEEEYKGEPVYRLSAEWATRYGISYWDFGGDRNLKSAQGSHKAVVLVSKRTGSAIFMTDTVDETFIYNDGSKVGFKGTILQFTEYPPATDYQKIMPALKRIGAVAKANNSKSDDSASSASAGQGGAGGSSGAGKNGTGRDGDSASGSKIAKNDTTGGSGSSGKNGIGFGSDGASVSDTAKSGTSSEATGGQDGTGGIGKHLAKADDMKDDESLWRDAESKTVSNNVADKDNDNEKSAGNAGSSARGDTSVISDKKSDEGSAKQKIAEVIPVQKDEDDLGENKITVEETDAGIKLSIHDLKFKADSSDLLPGEEKRLDEIAGILKLVPESMLLVEGHTADTGNPRGEMNLSKERAFKIADELSKRGINPDKFICKGSGATKPIADNSTSAGKAKNRRVEITILE